MFVDLGGNREVWCNIDQIVRIEATHHEGLVPAQPSEIVYAVTFSNGTVIGITKEELALIMNVSDSRK